MPLVEQKLFTFLEHLSSSPIICVVRVVRSLVFCVVFCRSLFVLVSFFPLTIVLSVLRITNSDYTFDIFKLFVLF